MAPNPRVLALRMTSPDGPPHPPADGPASTVGGGGDDDVRRAQAGDVEAFERIYRAHAPRVHALALRLTGDRARAEELVQDVFVRAWERLAGFRGEATLASWLHRLTVNELLTESRSAKRRAARALHAAWGVAPDEPVTLEPIDLERAIAALPPGARLVFVLHDVEGYRHDEIARLTGNATGTLRAQLHRARQLLMKALDR